MRQLAIVPCSLAVALTAAAAMDIWHPPVSIPNQCKEIEFEVLLVDVSKSMQRADMFDRVKDAISDRVRTRVPTCTLEIVASFGVTADVSAGEFLVNPESRDKLITAAMSLRPTHANTNFDEAAKLLELVSYQLRSAYGTPANRLTVRVYSDFVSSPSPGKPNFSLAEYLAQRMNARYQRVSAGELAAEQTIQVQTESAGGRNVTERPEIEAKVSNAKVVAVVVGVALLLITLILLLWFRSRRSSPMLVGGPVALLVTERAPIPADGTQEGFTNERRIEVAIGVPAVFSTDANHATYVAAEVAGCTNGELFRVEPLPDGIVRIQSPHPRLTVNDEPLDADRRRKISLRDPIWIRLGPREFGITGVFGTLGSFRHEDDVFGAEALHE